MVVIFLNTPRLDGSQTNLLREFLGTIRVSLGPWQVVKLAQNTQLVDKL